MVSPRKAGIQQHSTRELYRSVPTVILPRVMNHSSGLIWIIYRIYRDPGTLIDPRINDVDVDVKSSLKIMVQKCPELICPLGFGMYPLVI